MTYRYVKQSGIGLRYDVISSSGRRIAIAHNEGDAARVVSALNRQAVEAVDSLEFEMFFYRGLK